MSELETRLAKYQIKQISTPKTVKEEKLFKRLGFDAKIKQLNDQRKLFERSKRWLLLKNPSWDDIELQKNYRYYRVSGIPLEKNKFNDWSKPLVRLWGFIVPVIWFSVWFVLPALISAETFFMVLGVAIIATFFCAMGWGLILACILETSVNYKCLVNTPVESYKGEVPKAILQRAVEQQKEFEGFRIWSILRHSEIAEFDQGTLMALDPILVGTFKDANYVAFIGLWGDDLEEINTVLERGTKP